MGLFPTEDPGYLDTYAQEAAMVDASEAIATALESSDFTQAELARRLGVSRSEVSERLRGDRNITVRNLAATIHALGGRLVIDVELPPREPRSSAAYRRWEQPSGVAHSDETPSHRGLALRPVEH